MRFASFFAGIGGFDLGFHHAGIIPAFHCEIDPYCQRILKRHWPEVPLHDDITTLKAKDIPEADIWAGGWPCQDVSAANAQRKGIHGARSGLFFTFTALARKVRPSWIVLENVSGLLSSDGGSAFESVVNELEEIGYMGVWFTCNTLSAGLPHNRERVFLVGSYRSALSHQFYSDCGELLRDDSPRKARGTETRSDIRREFISDTPLLVQRRGGFGYTKATSYCPTIRAQTGKHQGGHTDRPILCGQKLDLERVRKTNGFPGRLDGRRGRLIGNAVAPPIAEFIGRRILAIQQNAMPTESMAAD
jgi:DNA (cytosine-5)-methyltransferase 1